MLKLLDLPRRPKAASAGPPEPLPTPGDQTRPGRLSGRLTDLLAPQPVSGRIRVAGRSVRGERGVGGGKRKRHRAVTRRGRRRRSRRTRRPLAARVGGISAPYRPEVGRQRHNEARPQLTPDWLDEEARPRPLALYERRLAATRSQCALPAAPPIGGL